MEELRRQNTDLTVVVDGLRAGEAKLLARLAAAEHLVLTKSSEVESLRVLASENAMLREELSVAHRKLREQEVLRTTATVAHTPAGVQSTAAPLPSDVHAGVTVKLQAYQRHNYFLQTELVDRDTRLKATMEKLECLREELVTKDRRMSLLCEKLRSVHQDPNAVVRSSVHAHVPLELIYELKTKITEQRESLDSLNAGAAAMQEELQRKEDVIAAVQKENSALRQSVTKLVDHIRHSCDGSGVTVPISAAEAAGHRNGTVQVTPLSLADGDSDPVPSKLKVRAAPTPSDTKLRLAALHKRLRAQSNGGA